MMTIPLNLKKFPNNLNNYLKIERKKQYLQRTISNKKMIKKKNKNNNIRRKTRMQTRMKIIIIMIKKKLKKLKLLFSLYMRSWPWINNNRKKQSNKNLKKLIFFKRQGLIRIKERKINNKTT